MESKSIDTARLLEAYGEESIFMSLKNQKLTKFVHQGTHRILKNTSQIRFDRKSSMGISNVQTKSVNYLGGR